MTSRLADRVAVVTGGGAGIGEAACLRFAEEGASVVVVDRDGTSAEETAAAIDDALLFLASDEASFVTGVNIPVDGGSSVN